MIKKYSLLILCLLFVNDDFAQLNSEVDTLKLSRQMTGDEVLLRYTEILKNDAKDHREYVELYYDKILYAFSGIGSVMAILLGFFGWKTYKNVIADAKIEAKGMLDGLFEAAMKQELEKFWLKKGMEERLLDLVTKNQQNTNINKKQEVMIANLNKIVTALKNSLKSNFRFNKSITKLEYLKKDGSEVLYTKEQGLICISEKLTETTETLYLGEGTTIEVIEIGPNYEVTKDNSKCEIKLKFDPPLTASSPVYLKKFKCKFSNCFTEKSEWWEVFQLYKCEEEIFIIKFEKLANCKSMWVEELDLDDKSKRISCQMNVEESGGSVLHTVNLPTSETPVRYRIHWEFQ